MSFRNKILRGTAMKVINMVIIVLLSLYTMPLLISTLGDEYGIWVVVGAFLGYYGLLDLGLATAVRVLSAQAFGREDYDEMSKILSSAFVIFCGLGVIVILMSLLVFFISPVFFENTHYGHLFRVSSIILGIGVSLQFPIMAYTGILSATIQHDIQTAVDVVFSILRTILTIIVVKTGGGIIELACVMFVITVGTFVCDYVVARRTLPNVKIETKNISKDKVFELLSYSKNAFIAYSCAMIRTKITPLIIGLSCGIPAIIPYTVAFRLVEYYEQLIVSINNVVAPLGGHAAGRGEQRIINSLLSRIMNLNMMITGYVGVSIFVYGDAFIRIWLHDTPEYHNSSQLLHILLVGFVILLFVNPIKQLMFNTNNHNYCARINAYQAILTIILTYVLGKIFGITGATIGLSLSMALPEILTFIYAKRIYNYVISKEIYYYLIWYLLYMLCAPKYIIPHLHTFYDIFIFNVIQFCIFIPMFLTQYVIAHIQKNR